MASQKTFHIVAVSLIAAFSLNSVSCVNTYDATGRPRQTVDPVVAVAGVAAAGLVGYAIAKDHRNDRKSYHHRPSYDDDHCDYGYDDGYGGYGY